MLFRAVIYSTDHAVNILWINNRGNWFSFRGRSYRKDRKAVCQVMNKGGQVKGVVEALYVEGNPLPIGSKLDVKTVTDEHLTELFSRAGNRPQESFWDKIFGR